MYVGNKCIADLLNSLVLMKPSQLVGDSKSPFCETESLIIATHCDVNTAPLPRVTGTFWPVGGSALNRTKYSKFSQIIPGSRVTLRSSMGSKAMRRKEKTN